MASQDDRAGTADIGIGVYSQPSLSVGAVETGTGAAADASKRTVVYTDGACIDNPGPGGWAWVIPGGGWACGADPSTTNQRMELTAALEALREVDGPVEVVSDSTYVVNCFRDRWHVGWRKRGWRNAKRKPVANRDLWEPLLALFLPREQEISWRWVKGHSGDEWNEMADQLALGAATDQHSRRGRRLRGQRLRGRTTGRGV